MNLNYNIYTRDIGDMDTRAVNWLKNISTKTWARHMFDPEVNVNNTNNNLDKSFNNQIGKYKSMPILLLLEKVRLKPITRFHDIFAQSKNQTIKTIPHVKRVFGKFVGKNNNVRMIATIYNEYQVYEGQTRHCINLEKNYCSCREWTMIGKCCPLY